MVPNLGYVIIGIVVVIFIILSIKWIANDPSLKQGPVPKSGRERLEWQAKHGSNWAKTVLILMDERDMLTEITLAHMTLEATMTIDKDSTEYLALYKVQHKYYDHIARIYNKEEC